MSLVVKEQTTMWGMTLFFVEQLYSIYRTYTQKKGPVTSTSDKESPIAYTLLYFS